MSYLETKIPIKNIYYMLLYCLNKIEYIDTVKVNIIKENEMLNLFATILYDEISNIVKKGLENDCNTINQVTTKLGGVIDFDNTIKENCLINGQVYCNTNHFTNDILHNCILKYTLNYLLQSTDIDTINKIKIKKIYKNFDNISNINITQDDFDKINIHKNNIYYKVALDICKIIYYGFMVNEDYGEYSFIKYFKDRNKMSMLFENFVRNFYKINLKNCTVTRENIKWDADIQTNEINILPIMMTDCIIKSESYIKIIDTKYYAETLISKNLTSEYKKSLRSNHLYQIFTYLKQSEAKGDIYKKASGILIYPQILDFVDYTFITQGHTIKVATLDLNKDWRDIHNRLLEIIN